MVTFRAKGRQWSAVDIEYLDAMVVAIAHNDAVCVAHCDVVRMFQHSTPTSARAKLSYKCSVRLEHLDSKTRIAVSMSVRLQVQTKSHTDDSPCHTRK